MTVASQSYLPPLGTQLREEIGGQLETVLVDLIDLSLWGKQLHWTVVGPLFRALHERLDELVDSWRELADTVAERAVAIGHWPDGQARALGGAESKPAVERGPVEDHVVLRLLSSRLAEVSEHARVVSDWLGALDTVSQDVMIDVVRELETQLWMSRAQLPTAGDH
jgi:starvation-inducible DNA-binding protein